MLMPAILGPLPCELHRVDQDEPRPCLAAIPVECDRFQGEVDDVRDRLLRPELPVGGSQQCESPAFPVHGVLPGRERDVSPMRCSSHGGPTKVAGLITSEWMQRTTSRVPCGS